MNKYEVRQRPLALAVTSVLAAGSLQAATITVDSALDGPVGSHPSECTLRAAIAAANTDQPVDSCLAGDPGFDAIVFDPVLINSTITIADPDSPFEVTSSMAIHGPMPGDYDGLIVDGGGLSQVFDLVGGTDPIDVALDSLTVTGGSSLQEGGGLLAEQVHLSITDALIDSNYSDERGGALVAGASVVLLQNSIVSNNAVGSLRSGAGIVVDSSEVMIESSWIQGNSSGVTGSGLVARYGSVVTVTDSVFSGNEIGFGSGAGLLLAGSTLYLQRSSVSQNRSLGTGSGVGVAAVASDVHIHESEVTGNTAYSLGGSQNLGGGVAVSYGTLTITDSSITENQLSGFVLARGGGVFVKDTMVLVSNSRISGNRVISTTTYSDPRAGGAGVYIENGSAVFSQTEISGNIAQGPLQRAAAVGTGASDLIMTNVTLSGNLLENGGGNPGEAGFVLDARASGSIELTHVTMADNQGGAISLQAIYRSPGIGLSLRGALLQHSASSEVCSSMADIEYSSLVTDNSCTGVDTSDALIALQPLSDNGGSSLTHALGPSSVAIDAAGNCRVVDGIDTDQRGVARGDLCDVGAFELLDKQIFSDRFEALP